MPMLRHVSAAALLGLTLATPLRADVTADQVWILLQDVLTEPGFALSGTENRRGNALVLTRLRLTFESGEIVQLPEITLRELPDKSVSIELPPRFPLLIDLPPHATDPDTLSITVAAPDLKIILRGLGVQTDVSLSSGSISASLDPIVWPAAQLVPKGDLFAAVAVADLTANFKLVMDQTQSSIDGDLSIATVHGDFRVVIPGESIKGDMSLDMSALSAKLSAFGPPGTLETLNTIDQNKDPHLPALITLLDQGLKLDVDARIGSASLLADVPTNPDGPFKLDISSKNGVFTTNFDRAGAGFSAGIGATRAFVQMMDQDVPFTDVAATIEEFSEAYSMGFPQTGSVDSPAWGISYRLMGATLSDNIWNLADPDKLFPRDPVTLVLDLGGTYSVDPKALKPGWVSPDMGGANPFTAVTLDLKEVIATGLGLSITGTGSLAFDLLNPVMIDDYILPMGKVGFVTIGANGMIDRLSALGQISDEDRTAARFGLMFMGRMEGGDDRLVTNMEFRDGGFFLNGQKIR